MSDTEHLHEMARRTQREAKKILKKMPKAVTDLDRTWTQVATALNAGKPVSQDVMNRTICRLEELIHNLRHHTYYAIWAKRELTNQDGE